MITDNENQEYEDLQEKEELEVSDNETALSEDEEVVSAASEDSEGEEQAESTAESDSKRKNLLGALLRDDDGDGDSLKDMFKDMRISGEWMMQHWAFILLFFTCMLVFVTNRYQAQQEIIEEAKLKQELNDCKYIWLTRFSELTRSSRQSQIEEHLLQRGDSTLKASKDAPFIIKVK